MTPDEGEPDSTEAQTDTPDTPLPGPDAVCWEYQAGEQPIRLSFSILVF